MLSPWDPQDSATTWYHSTFHCGEGGLCFSGVESPSRSYFSLFFLLVSLSGLRGSGPGRPSLGSTPEYQKRSRSAWRWETFAFTQPALVTSVGFWQTCGYHIFTWMNCTLQLLLCTRNPKVLTLKTEFSLSSCFSSPVFKGDLFLMAVAMGLLFTSS